MDSVDPGALLAAMSSGSANGAPAPGNIDAQIMALLKQTTPRPDEGTNAQDANAGAAQTAYQSAQSKPATLQVGLGPFLRTDTHIPIPHWLDQGLVGGGGDLYRQFANNIEHPLGIQPDPMKLAVNQQAQSTTAGRVGALATEAAESVPLGMGTAGVLGKLGTAGVLGKLGSLGARAAANPISLGAIQGGIQGGLMADPGQRLQGAALGGLLGGAIPTASAVGGKIASGLSRTPEAQALLNRGVTLPPGMLNSGGLGNKLEQGLTGLPLVGGKISGARARALPAFTQSVFKDALAPGDTLAGNDLNEMFANAKAGYDTAYSAIKGYPMKPAAVNVKGPDVPLAQSFQDIADQSRLGLPAGQRAAMGQQLQDQLNETLRVAQQNGRPLMSEDLQSLRSQIRDASRDVSPVDNASRAQQGFWNDAESAVTKALNSQLPPKIANQLQAIDKQYGGFKIMQSAIAAAKDKPEGPTLQQLSTAIKQATNPTTYAAGGGWNRDAVKAAQSVFGSNVPLTGLTGAGTVTPIMRAVEHTLGGLGVGAGIEGATHIGAVAAHPLALGGTAAGLGGLWGAYTQPGMRALAGQTGWQQGLLQAGTHVSPATRRLITAAIRGGLLGAANQGLPNRGLLGQPQ